MQSPFVKVLVLVSAFCVGAIGGGLGLFVLSLHMVAPCRAGERCSDGPMLGAFSWAVLRALVIGLLAAWGAEILYRRSARRRNMAAA